MQRFQRLALCSALLPLLAGAACALAQEDKPADPPPLETESAKFDWGYLSDPANPAENIWEALAGGKVHLNDRLRFEYADTTGRKPSYAITNRLRLGYETKAYYGFSAMAEMENVFTPDKSLYSVPPTGDGDPDRTPVADPPGTEVNQAYLRFNSADIEESGVSLDARGGRQRIILDDSRFVGNVGWRQFEQTYDAVSVRSNLGVDNLTVTYAYLWHVQRIFGPDGPNWDSDSHLANVSYTFVPEVTVTPFAYLLDFRDDAPLNSTNSYGLRVSGQIARNADDEADFFVHYEATYARQTDAGSNPVDFDADFIAGEIKAVWSGTGSAAVGYQLLGSDDGMYGFSFPLGTNHKFQGFADVFLATPATGLQDLYIAGALELPYGIEPALIAHQFWSDEGGTDLGFEADAVVSKRFTPNLAVLAKAAFFDGHNGLPDTTRLWIEATFSF